MSVDISSLNICEVPWALLLVCMGSWGGFSDALKWPVPVKGLFIAFRAPEYVFLYL